MSDPAHVKCRFMATPSSAMAHVTYKGVVLTIRSARTEDPDQDRRDLKTLVRVLPKVLDKGAEEIWVQDQARRLDYELEEFFRDLDAEEGKGDE